jgi:hypothetical protein
VVKPPQPCVVPKLGVHQTLSTVERRIKTAHCSVGKIRYTPSSRRAHGVVLGLSPRSATKHASGAAVAIEVSSGPPPRVKHRRRR